MKSYLVTSLLALFLVCIAYEEMLAQADSLEIVQHDSLLAAREKRSQRLLSRVDSIHIRDSVQRSVILNKIAELQANELQEKQRLQSRLDSIRQIQALRADQIEEQVERLRETTPGVPVVVFKDTILYIYSKLGPYSPHDRAVNIVHRVELLVREGLYDPANIFIEENIESHDIVHGEIIIHSVTDRDAFWQGSNRIEVAQQFSEAVQLAIEEYRSRTGILTFLKRAGLLILVLSLFLLGIRYLNKGFTWFNKWLVSKGNKFIVAIRFRNYEFLPKERSVQLTRWGLKVIKWISIAFIVYLTLPAVFSIFPATQGISNTLFGYVLNPLKAFGAAFLAYIPSLITIVLIVFLAFYFVRFLKFLSREIESEKLRIPGFYPEWATPTFNLVRIIVYAFSFIVIFPYLPGSESPVFRGVSVFFGLLLSLGSSSAISNIVAGLVINYMRAFKIGDRVRIGDTTGDVLEKTMLVTKLRTIKNEDITIPNSAVLSGSTINFTSSARDLGLILNSTVTIGYDVPWRKVHELLINAALKTDHIKKNPEPFVLQTSLDDFYVSYQINAYTEQAGMAAKIYSQLHSNIQDLFGEAGVEIMSPHYRAERDGSSSTIPPDQLPTD